MKTMAKAMNADKVWIDHGYVDVNARFHLHVYEPFNHTDPATCLGLAEQHGIASIRKKFSLGHFWECRVLDVGSESHYIVAHGKTLAEAVARCVVAMRLGDEFECPSELGGGD